VGRVVVVEVGWSVGVVKKEIKIYIYIHRLLLTFTTRPHFHTHFHVKPLIYTHSHTHTHTYALQQRNLIFIRHVPDPDLKGSYRTHTQHSHPPTHTPPWPPHPYLTHLHFPSSNVSSWGIEPLCWRTAMGAWGDAKESLQPRTHLTTLTRTRPAHTLTTHTHTHKKEETGTGKKGCVEKKKKKNYIYVRE
jgi:hypothetical protein